MISSKPRHMEPYFAQKVWWEWLEPSATPLSFEKIPVLLPFLGVPATVVESAFRTVLDNQIILRLVFRNTPLGIRVVEQDSRNIGIKHLNFSSARTATEAMEAAREYLIKHQLRPLSRQTDKLIDASIVILPREICFLAVNFHHLIFDGISVGLFSRQIRNLIGAQCTELTGPMFTLDDYLELVKREREFVAGPEGQARLVYWKSWLEDVPPLRGPTRATDLSCRSGTMATYPFSFTGSLAERGAHLAKTLNVPKFVIWLTIFAVTLCKWSSQERFGIRVTGNLRGAGKSLRAIGLFTCADPMEIWIDAGSPFSSLARELLKKYLYSLAMRLPPLPSEYGIGKRGEIGPLFNFIPTGEEQSPPNTIELHDNRWPSLHLMKSREKLPIASASLQLKIRHSGQSVWGQFELNEDLICKDDRRMILDTFSVVIRDLFPIGTT